MSDPKPVHATPGVLRRVSACAGVVLAPNPGPMTLDGTNTWILSAPGDGPEHPNYGHHPSAQGRGEWPGPDVVVVDPGPLDEAHLQAVADEVEARGGIVDLRALDPQLLGRRLDEV